MNYFRKREAMSSEHGEIRLPLINNYIRIIKNLAVRGRGAYQEYLVHPLGTWSDLVPQEKLEKLTRLLKHEKRKHVSYDLPKIFKKAIIKSVAPDQLDLSLPGNLSIDFLDEMRHRHEISSSAEARQFVDILRDPFSIFNDKEFRRMNSKFRQTVSSSDPEEIMALLEAQRAAGDASLKEKEQSCELINSITKGLEIKDIAKLKKEAVTYLLKIATPRAPDLHTEIDPLLAKIDLHHEGFSKEVFDTTAILIYHEIIKSIRENKLKRAVLLIAQYAVLFRGNPSTPNALEVGSFEKILFDLIEKKNLWDRI
jgi:hypothetical protein